MKGNNVQSWVLDCGSTGLQDVAECHRHCVADTGFFALCIHGCFNTGDSAWDHSVRAAGFTIRVQRTRKCTERSTITGSSWLKALGTIHSEPQSVTTMNGQRFELSTWKIQVRDATPEPTCVRTRVAIWYRTHQGCSSSTLILVQADL